MEDIAMTETTNGKERDFDPGKAIARWELEGAALRNSRSRRALRQPSKSAGSQSNRPNEPLPTKRLNVISFWSLRVQENGIQSAF
jgi:hypothetical protein